MGTFCTSTSLDEVQDSEATQMLSAESLRILKGDWQVFWLP